MNVSRAQKISTVVDTGADFVALLVSRAQKISTVVDMEYKMSELRFHALKKFLLL